MEFSREWDRWERDYPLKLSEKRYPKGQPEFPRRTSAVLKGMIKNVTSYHKDQKGRSGPTKEKASS